MTKKYCSNHLCESCLHLLQEKGVDIQDDFQECDLSCLNQQTDLHCPNCGAFIGVCREMQNLKRTQKTLVESAIKNPKIQVVCYTAPSIRASISEAFGAGNVEDAQGKLVSALKLLGFDVVFDMNVAADFTVMEEANEFCKRLKENKNLPMMTSCCPGWVNYVTKFHKNFIPNLSTCKSPQQMFGALLNTYYVERLGKKSSDIFVVSIVPCLAKKLEAKQDGINASNGFDVDASITTTELIEMILESGIDFLSLEKSDFDPFFGSASGAGTIFGNTGGVMEAVLRTVGDTIEKKEIEESMYLLVRGEDGVRKATFNLGGREIKVAVVSGIMNAKELLETINKNEEQFDFVEVMACPGGCVGGGGQPRHDLDQIPEYTRKRAKVLYKSEILTEHKKAHKNPAISNVYKNYLGSIGGKKAQSVLHRKY